MKISKTQLLQALKTLETTLSKCEFTYTKSLEPEAVGYIMKTYGEVSYCGGLVKGLIEMLEMDEDVINDNSGVS